MQMSKIVIYTLIPAALLAASSEARSNCARPVHYLPTVTGNTVQVQPVNYEDRACPDPEGMIRQSVDNGEIVKLADFCVATEELAAYVDECVAPGKYRYGFAKPYDCEPYACGTSFFAEVSVTSPLDPACMRSAGNSPPTTAAAVPWRNDPFICDYQGGDPSRGGESSWTGGSGPKSSGGSEAEEIPHAAGGCSVAITPGVGSVIGANALALVVGLLLMWNRRSNKP